jgi:hypothetical protein
MKEAPDTIQLNIDRYPAILGRPIAEQRRVSVEQLLAEAISRLARATHPGVR